VRAGRGDAAATGAAMRSAGAVSSAEDADERADMCRRLIAERRLIGAQLGFDFCPSPTWDILLDLYLARCERRRTYVWSLCMAAHVPTTSAHRKIAELVRQGWLARGADSDDGRRISVALTDEALARLDALFDRMVQQASTR